MIRREADALVVEGPLTLATVPELVEAARGHFGEGVRSVSFAGVSDIDSSAVALALEWQRQAALQSITLRLEDMPEAMLNLAALYGVAELLQDGPA